MEATTHCEGCAREKELVDLAFFLGDLVVGQADNLETALAAFKRLIALDEALAEEIGVRLRDYTVALDAVPSFVPILDTIRRVGLQRTERAHGHQPCEGHSDDLA